MAIIQTTDDQSFSEWLANCNLLSTKVGDYATVYSTIGGGLSTGLTAPTTVVNALNDLNTRKFNVSGGTVTGTLRVNQAVTFDSTLDVAGATGVGSFAVATNKFTVSAAGNTAIAGTLDVTGVTSLNNSVAMAGTGNFTVNINKFTVAYTTGNTTVGGTFGVTGATTLSSTLGVTGAATFSDDIAVNGGDITTTATATTIFNTNATSISFGGAADITMGGAAKTVTISGAFTVATGKAATFGGTSQFNDNVSIASGKTLTIAGAFSQTGANTFSTGTGAVSLNGDVTIAASKSLSLSGNIAQTGANTFSTGTGAVSLNGNTTVAAGKSLTASGGGSLTGTWSDLGTVTTVVINGGSINGASIGATTQSTGAFTSVDFGQSVQLSQTTTITSDVATNTVISPAISAATYSTVEFTVQIKEGATKVKIVKILAACDGTNVDFTEYGMAAIGTLTTEPVLEVVKGTTNIELRVKNAIVPDLTYKVTALATKA